ncbi:MAG TPA: DUF2203 domain-containing protein [Acidimicrobiales bacterium]|nr:DUF2203 domain-containing protein [Acidimicrobiales bacterium]
MRYWTVDEARAYLPRLRLLLGVIRRASRLAVSARGNGHATLPGAPSPTGPEAGEPGSEPVAEHASPEADSPVAFDVKKALAELQDKGIVLRDPGRGLIDFPARHGGRDVLLCWQLGDDDLGWWHFPEEGFAGRRPLPLPGEL